MVLFRILFAAAAISRSQRVQDPPLATAVLFFQKPPASISTGTLTSACLSGHLNCPGSASFGNCSIEGAEHGLHTRELPGHILDDPKRSSEARVYDRMREKLPGDYNRYYPRSWHEADDSGVEVDGKADFIVVHAEHGLLFLKVKGGRVSCREADGQWLSEDRDGFKFKIKDPLSQARSSKHHFLRRLKESRAIPIVAFRSAHASGTPTIAPS
ncbi:MAG: nuclease-related domain-containing protein [Albidovulum sp.]|nr:nuclease-related domain-containing protein [Albidovulum sp.]